METIKVKKISAGTVYKLIAMGLTIGLLPIFLLFGILGAFGMESLTWNEEPVTGIKAIFISPLMAIFMSLLFTAIMGSLTVLGLWILSFFKSISIEFVVSDT